MSNTSADRSARDRIIDAAVALFCANGYHETGTRDIARIATVSEVTLFRHFSSKEHLFLVALRSIYRPIHAHRERVLKGLNPSTSEELLRAILRAMVDIVLYYPEAVRLSAIAMVEVRGDAERECIAQFSPLFTAVDSSLGSMMEAGALQKLDTAMLTTAMTLTSLGYPLLRGCIPQGQIPAAGSNKLLDRYSAFWNAMLGAHTGELAPRAQ